MAPRFIAQQLARPHVFVGFLPKSRMQRMRMPADIFTLRAPGEVIAALERLRFGGVRVERPEPSTPRTVIAASPLRHERSRQPRMSYGCTHNDRSRWLGAPGLIIGYVWRAYWDWRTRRVMLLLLQSLNARTLKDIGVTPGEVSSFLDGRAWLNNVPGRDVAELTSKEAGRHRSAPTTLVGTLREHGL